MTSANALFYTTPYTREQCEEIIKECDRTGHDVGQIVNMSVAAGLGFGYLIAMMEMWPDK